MDFPEWSPSGLVEYYKKRFDGNVNINNGQQADKKLLIALATNQEMKSVWEMFCRQKDHYQNPVMLFFCISDALIQSRQPVMWLH